MYDDEMDGYVIPLPFCPIFIRAHYEPTLKEFKGFFKHIMHGNWKVSGWKPMEWQTPIEWDGNPEEIASIYYGKLVKAKYWHGEDKAELVYDPYVCESYTMTAPSICLTFVNGETDVYSIADWNNHRIAAMY